MTLNLKIIWNKVKVHSSDPLNLATDRFAKSAITAPLLTFDYTTLTDTQLILHCTHLPIESSSYQTMKKLQKYYQLF